MPRRASLPLLSLLAAHLACASTTGGAAADPVRPAHDPTEMRKAARAQLEELASAASAFTFENGRCPQSIDDLLHPPSGAPLIAAMPADPWGQPIALMRLAEDTPGTAFVSGGPDGELLSGDDITVRADCSER